jgi:predicted TIM-barrel fold metal-dependent hydrolase
LALDGPALAKEEAAMLIDVHAHYSPRAWTGLMLRINGARRPPDWAAQPDNDDPDQIAGRLRLMDEAGVQMQILSHGIMAPYAENEADAVEAARLCNDCYVELVRRHPDRFRAYVSLPLPHVEASLREMARGLDGLGMAGVTMNCSVFNRSVAEREFDPLYEEMNRRGSILYTHPGGSCICSPMISDYGLNNAAGNPLEDSILALHMIVKQIPIRYPNIRVIISHLGGVVPMLLDRMDHQMRREHLTEAPSGTARRFYYDTVGHGSHAALLAAWKAFGADRILPGSDYPVLLASEPYGETFSYIKDVGLPGDDADRILNRNAPALFGLTGTT